MQVRLLRRRGIVTFAFFVLATEIAGRSLTARVDRALHVRPLARSGAGYYPFLLIGVKVAGALLLAALVARGLRAWAAASAGERLLASVGASHEHRSPRLRPGLSGRVWLASFLSTSGLYLVHADADSLALGRWSLLAPFLHSYALPVFAVLAVLVALAWRLAGWLHAVEEYAHLTMARVRRLFSSVHAEPVRHGRPCDDSAPRRRFGLAFESRPPPLAV